ncbi:MAG: Sister chromatid cohesion protein 2 [Claussenomyces sp. TS43310]|nr:MAG: Sister chromatid cohesion protein 2 [Claussenomyces sp. TS43310]
MQGEGHTGSRPGHVPNGSNGVHLESGTGKMRSKPFTVEEALAYTPMSSVVPFNTDIIPSPSVGLQASPSIFANAAEQAQAQRGLDSLNQDAADPSRTSQKLERTLRTLQELLRPENLTSFKFKNSRPPTTACPPNAQYELKMSLSPFAQRLFDSTDVPYQPLTPETPGSRSERGSGIHTQPKKTPAKERSKAPSKPVHGVSAAQVIFNQEAPNPKATREIPRLPPQAIRPLTPPSASPVPTPGPAVSLILPNANDIINTQEYIEYKESPAKTDFSSNKQKRLQAPETQEFLDTGSDQREKANIAFRNLQTFLQDIFEAEDQYHSNGVANAEIFTSTGETPSLTSAVHTRVEGLLQKSMSFGNFSQAPLDDLIRLQKLCEGSLRTIETMDVRIDTSWESADVEAWLKKLPLLETGLRSGRTALRLMAGGRDEKQLYSEEIIQLSLNALKNVIDGATVPIVEMRSSGSTSTLFKLFSAGKKAISGVLFQCRRLLSMIGELISKIDLSEAVVNTLEFLVSQLIFVENAHAEKDSVLGIQKYDVLRVVAMDTLAQIFSNYPGQRQGIIDDVLTSLEKLPSTKQSARQFRLMEGGSIQLVSALIMRLIQTSANKLNDRQTKRTQVGSRELGEEDAETDELADEPDDVYKGPEISPNDTEQRAAQQSVTAVQELQATVSPLIDTAKQSAQYVVGYIVGRAMTSTKNGDTPYRNLLDLFVQDFITCLNSTDWPAAELLLRLFLFKMVSLAEGEKTAAPAKNMALDLLGEMGAAISHLNSHVRNTAGALDSTEGDVELGGQLARLAAASLEGKLKAEQLVAWNGPYRGSLEYLDKRCSEDNALQSAVGYRMADWASQIQIIYDNINDDDQDHEEVEEDFGRLAYRLRMMLFNRRWLSSEYTFRAISVGHARLAYAITIMNSQFCRSFERVLMILLGSMSSEQATVRSKSLKSVNQVLETDPTILDRGNSVIRLILRCSSDPSPQVRDSALGLIGKCIGLRPPLENDALPDILLRVSDSGLSVRKRAIRLLKEIYLRNDKEDVRTAIADALLHRVTDLDTGVQELARQTMEDIWMAPFYLPVSVDDLSVQYRLSITNHVRLMINTVKRNSGAAVLDKVLQSMLSTKLAAANFRVCKTLVATMFDSILDSSTTVGGERLEARDSLQLLMTFAKAEPKLFTADQIHLLQPYIANVKSEDDMAVFRAVVVIFRYVLPHLSSVHSNFLVAVRTALMPSIQRLTKTLLDDVVACLWIISTTLDSYENLSRVAISCLDGIRKLQGVNLSNPSGTANCRKLLKLLLISGIIGKHCDLDSQESLFRKSFPAWKGSSVAKLMVDMFTPFASPAQNFDVRKGALDAIGLVCQSWPKNFSSVNVYTTFQQVFEEKYPPLETTILRSFNEFLIQEEKRSDPSTEVAVGAAIETPATLGIMGGTQADGVALEIAQKFLKDITRIATATQDDHALLATEILASINRQGLHHPKDCGSALVALETSQNPKIAELAAREHRSLHEKYETIMEKEYMRAVQAAFCYQRDIAKDVRGALKGSYTAKLYLLMDVLKISKPKGRKRFLESLCTRIDFEPAKLDVSQNPPDHVLFSQFVIENMAFFEYHSIDDLQVAITAMEKVVAGTGAGVAHAIESEIFRVRMENGAPTTDGAGVVTLALEPAIDYSRFYQLTAASMILSSLWEARTYLRRSYGLMTNKRETKGKGAAKDLSKAPVKVQGVTGDRVWAEFSKIMLALRSQEAMMEQCKAFVELLTVDKDFKIAAEGEDETTAKMRFTTPSDEEGDASLGALSGSGRGRKRKTSGTPGMRKKRARSGSKGPGKRNGRGSYDSGEEEDPSMLF